MSLSLRSTASAPFGYSDVSTGEVWPRVTTHSKLLRSQMRSVSPCALGAVFLNRIKLMLPVQSSLQKYSCSLSTQITSTSSAVLVPHKGRLEIVTNAGQDAVDAGCALTNAHILRTEKSCGPDAPTLASSW
jgi:hypothetical protein